MRDGTAKLLSHLHTSAYRLSSGRVGRRLVDNDMLLLTTTGRRSGRSHTVPLLFLALELQSMLLVGFSGEGTVSGISAMPSMHVALSWIIAFQAFQYRKFLGWLMVAFAFLIQFSSVHLGWHYAIDGYLGFGVAIASWHMAKMLANLQAKFDARSAA